jgi:hypothetical protein
LNDLAIRTIEKTLFFIAFAIIHSLLEPVKLDDCDLQMPWVRYDSRIYENKSTSFFFRIKMVFPRPNLRMKHSQLRSSKGAFEV